MGIEDALSEVLGKRNIGLRRTRPDFTIAGSPERTEYRIVVEDMVGSLYIVERVAVGLKERKIRIARVLDHLAAAGFAQAHTYIRDDDGKYLTWCDNGFWQVVPYVAGVALDRPRYVHDGWRGAVMAELLTRFRRAARSNLSVFDGWPVFSLPDYIEGLMRSVGEYRPDLNERVSAFAGFARANLYPVYGRLPAALCHGDYHAINIIWQDKGIAALIDWEFVGLKPELYDAANMVGCLGIEDPDCLWKGAAFDFIRDLRAGGIADEISFKFFLELVISLRFAWLSEWLRKNDEEMIEMELDYFDVLNVHHEDLALLWGCKSLK